MEDKRANVSRNKPLGRRTGRVKFFDSQKGLNLDDPNEKNSVGRNESNLDLILVFVHHTAIINDREFKSLAEGEYVEYSLAEGPNGLQASEVTGPNGCSVIGDPPTRRSEWSMNGEDTELDEQMTHYPSYLLNYLITIGVLPPDVYNHPQSNLTKEESLVFDLQASDDSYHNPDTNTPIMESSNTSLLNTPPALQAENEYRSFWKEKRIHRIA